MSVKQRLDNQSKSIAMNVSKVCREEKQNGELFLPLASCSGDATLTGDETLSAEDK